ncbi:MAG: hypothetical protein H0U55_14195 [Rubrobacteraceae bacterium]|nr:hypothetical protein [Rubrobacteraceae bacterium]
MSPDEAFEWETGLPDCTVRLCPNHGEYDQLDYEEDQTCPFCDLTGETI